MKNIKIKFFQDSKNTISDFEIIDFCDTLLSINYKFDLISGIAKKITENKKYNNYIFFSNQKRYHIERQKINLESESFRDILLNSGEFISLYPNDTVFELNLIIKYYFKVNNIIYNYDNNFKREWTITKIIKNYFKFGFQVAVDEVEQVFIKAAILLKIPELIKTIEDNKYYCQEENSEFNSIKNKFYNTEDVINNYKTDYISKVFEKIRTNSFPVILYIDIENKDITNFSFNNFVEYDDFSLKSISHQSPWTVEASIVVGSSILALYMGWLKLQNYRYNIKKNKHDIKKTVVELKDKKINNLLKFIEDVNKSDSELNDIISKINLIDDAVIKNELLLILEDLVFKMEQITKKYKLSLKIENIENFK